MVFFIFWEVAMKGTITEKILRKNLISGELIPGEEIAVRVNQTLTQDSTGTMVYLQLEGINPKRIRTDLSVAYIDHNTLQSGFENADDHEFIRGCAEKYGIIFSKAGGGICHQVHLERFARPGALLIGSDSHTPTAGGIGSLAIGAGGLDVAVALAKGHYFLTVPKICSIHLQGKLRPQCSGKDVILAILKKLTVKGGVGFILEYGGEGARTLSVTDRATICNMGAELGATGSLFPSDQNTLDFLKRQGREHQWEELAADSDAEYARHLDLDLDQILPMAALPHSPDAVREVREIEGLPVDQVCIGSCTNSSYRDMMRVEHILRGRKIADRVSLVISPGSSGILRLLADNGALKTFIEAGARILESACGPCIGMGQAPRSGAVSLRTFNRNFKGRSGTADAEVYLVSPETAAFSALSGYLRAPSPSDIESAISEPESYGKSEGYFIFPKEIGKGSGEPPRMGPNIKPFPLGKPLSNRLEGLLLLKTGDNVTTDDIVPSSAKLLPFRSNIPHLSSYCFGTLCKDFKERARRSGGGFVVGGENYGQGSSREHAALVPLYLGVKGVIALSFARIHRANLINSGILPLTFQNPNDYEKLHEGDLLILDDLLTAVREGREILLKNAAENLLIPLQFQGSEREKNILEAGGYLNFVKNGTKGGADK